jgi:hypothetical protein
MIRFRDRAISSAFREMSLHDADLYQILPVRISGDSKSPTCAE